MKTHFKYDHYFRQTEIEQNLKYFKNTYPSLMNYKSICKTDDGFNIWAVTITNISTGNADEKPAFYIDGNTHAGEVTGMMAAMYTIDYLLTNYQNDDRIKALLDEQTFYIIPSVSPDGSDYYLSSAYNLRSVNREYYLEEKGLQAEDIDNDGVIRMMRIKSDYGCWKIDKNDPDLMILREPDDKKGTYYNVYTEGSVDEYDGLNLKIGKNKYGLDFNRNYPFGWYQETRQPGAGDYPLCNRETKAVAEFIIDHPNICSVATNHTCGGVLLTPPGTYPAKKADPKDMLIYNAIGRMGTEVTGYPHINIFDTFTTDQENYASGAFDDFCYECFGIYAITIELWDADRRCGITDFWDEKDWSVNKQITNYGKRVKWIKENCPQYFKKWQKMNHPVLGEVETGGINSKFTHQNPPEQLLEEVLKNYCKFVVRWANILPKVVIDQVRIQQIADGIHKIEVVISNKGYLPTYISNNRVKLKKNKGIIVSVNADKEDFITGEPVTNIGDLSSFALTNTEIGFTSNISTADGEPISKKLTYLYKGKAETLTIKVKSCNAGMAEITIKI